MPFVYGLGLATAGNTTLSGTPGTATEIFQLDPGTGRGPNLSALHITGKQASATAISGIIARAKVWTTGSTGGTSATPSPRHSAYPAAATACTTLPTPGSGGGATKFAVGCGAAGPGGWVAPTQDAYVSLPAADAGSISVDAASGLASALMEWSGELVEF